MSDKWKQFAKFYRGCGLSDSEQVFNALKDLKKEDWPASIDEVRDFLKTLDKPDPIIELNGGDIK